MTDQAPLEPPSVTHALAVLAGSASALVVAAATSPAGYLPFAGVLSGITATLTVAAFAWRRARRAEHHVRRNSRSTSGRIVERSDGDRIVLDLPADGVEPWGFDAWVLGVLTLGLGLLGGFRPSIYWFEAFVIGAVGVRLFLMRNDRIRLELRPPGFVIDAVSANRPIRRAGSGPILPELAPDSLTLWSSHGRLGVLRSELTRSERTWLADRLASIAERFTSPARDANGEVDQDYPRDDGKREQRDHAE